MSLIEAMIAMGILMIGILGALQGTLHASRQNSLAARVARATSMAAQVRRGLEAQGWAKLTTASGLATATNCTAIGSASAPLRALTDGLDATAVANACIVDLDAFDAAAAAADKIVPSYNLAQDYNGGNGPYRRVVVFLPGNTLGRNASADSFVVVVSSKDATRRVFVRQVVGLYNFGPATATGTGNGTLVNL